jgi:hypothetical protein
LWDWIEEEFVSTAAVGCRDSGEVAADWWIEEDDWGFIEQRAIDEDDNEEQWSGVTHVEQLQQQLHVNEHELPACCCHLK